MEQRQSHQVSQGCQFFRQYRGGVPNSPPRQKNVKDGGLCF